MTAYTDVKHLEKHGRWPEGETPQWAAKMSPYNVVIRFAYAQEVARLKQVARAERLLAAQEITQLKQEIRRLKQAVKAECSLAEAATEYLKARKDSLDSHGIVA